MRKLYIVGILLAQSFLCWSAQANPSKCFYYKENGAIPNTEMTKVMNLDHPEDDIYEASVGQVELEIIFNKEGIFSVHFFEQSDEGKNRGAWFHGKHYFVTGGAGGNYDGFIVAFAQTTEGFLTIECN